MRFLNLPFNIDLGTLNPILPTRFFVPLVLEAHVAWPGAMGRITSAKFLTCQWLYFIQSLPRIPPGLGYEVYVVCYVL